MGALLYSIGPTGLQALGCTSVIAVLSGGRSLFIDAGSLRVGWVSMRASIDGPAGHAKAGAALPAAMARIVIHPGAADLFSLGIEPPRSRGSHVQAGPVALDSNAPKVRWQTVVGGARVPLETMGVLIDPGDGWMMELAAPDPSGDRIRVLGLSGGASDEPTGIPCARAINLVVAPGAANVVHFGASPPPRLD